jgi:hypothetical protein
MRGGQPGLAAPAGLESRLAQAGRSGDRQRLSSKGWFEAGGCSQSDTTRRSQNFWRNARRRRAGQPEALRVSQHRPTFCHSDRSEESLSVRVPNQREIVRFAQDDNRPRPVARPIRAAKTRRNAPRCSATCSRRAVPRQKSELRSAESCRPRRLSRMRAPTECAIASCRRPSSRQHPHPSL